ncbi:MAG: hypothetical protein WCG27_04955 [Pseudomonadota bacterium]
MQTRIKILVILGLFLLAMPLLAGGPVGNITIYQHMQKMLPNDELATTYEKWIEKEVKTNHEGLEVYLPNPQDKVSVQLYVEVTRSKPAESHFGCASVPDRVFITEKSGPIPLTPSGKLMVGSGYSVTYYGSQVFAAIKKMKVDFLSGDTVKIKSQFYIVGRIWDSRITDDANPGPGNPAVVYANAINSTKIKSLTKNIAEGELLLYVMAEENEFQIGLLKQGQLTLEQKQDRFSLSLSNLNNVVEKNWQCVLDMDKTNRVTLNLIHSDVKGLQADLMQTCSDVSVLRKVMKDLKVEIENALQKGK